MLLAGASVDDALESMRREGLSRIASISMLVELTGMSLRDAKVAVHMSRAWEDLRTDAEAFHERFEQAAENQPRKLEPESD
jgi:ribosomal protein L7/L12